jgi:hypothetical protein
LPFGSTATTGLKIRPWLATGAEIVVTLPVQPVCASAVAATPMTERVRAAEIDRIEPPKRAIGSSLENRLDVGVAAPLTKRGTMVRVFPWQSLEGPVEKPLKTLKAALKRPRP